MRIFKVYFRLKRWLVRSYKYKTLNPVRQNSIHVRERRKRVEKRFIATFGKCAKCKKTRNLTIDHIIPLSKGGSRRDKRNWQVLCERCNQYKADKLIKHLKGYSKANK